MSTTIAVFLFLAFQLQPISSDDPYQDMSLGLGNIAYTATLQEAVDALFDDNLINRYYQIYAETLFDHLYDEFLEHNIGNKSNSWVPILLQDLGFGGVALLPNVYNVEKSAGTYRDSLRAHWKIYRDSGYHQPVENYQIEIPPNLRFLFVEPHLLGPNGGQGRLNHSTLMAELLMYVHEYPVNDKDRRWLIRRLKHPKVRALKIKAIVGLTIFADFRRRVQRLQQAQENLRNQMAREQVEQAPEPQPNVMAIKRVQEPDEPEEEDQEWQLDPNFDINADLTDERVRQMLDFFGEEQPPPTTEQPRRKRLGWHKVGPNLAPPPRGGKKKPKHRSVDKDQESKSAEHWLVVIAAIGATLLLVALVGLGLYAWLLRPDGNGNSQGNAESSDGSNT